MRIRYFIIFSILTVMVSKSNAGLLARWEFDSNADSALPGDYTGTLIDNAFIATSGAKVGSGMLTLDGGVGTGEADDGDLGNSAEFDGVIQASGNDLDPDDGDYTVTAWIKPSDTSGRQHIIDKRFALNVFIVDGRYCAYIKGDGTASGINLLGNTWVSANTWTHVATVIDRNTDGTGTLTLYVNGEEDCSASIPADFGSIADSEFNIGVQYNRGTPQRGFNGSIDDVGVWDEAFDFHQVSFVMNNNVTSMSRGKVLMLQKGIQFVSHSVPTQFTGGFDVNMWNITNFSTACIHRDLTGGTVDHYDNMTNYGLPSGQDAIPFKALVMDTSHSVCSSQYLDKLTAVQLRDEDPIDAPALPGLAVEVSELKGKYPGALIYLDQSPVNAVDSNGDPHTITVSVLQNYMQACKPDMLCYFEYAFRWDDTIYFDYEGGSPTRMYQNMATFRAAALSGLDGSGTRPIPYGMFVQTYADVGSTYSNDRMPSESEYNLQLSAGLAFGFQSFEAFIYYWSNPSVLDPLFFDGNNYTPSLDFIHYSTLLREVRNIAPYLVRLRSTDVRMKMGQHYEGSTIVNNTLPTGVSALDGTASSFLDGVTVANGGNVNDGLTGDVIIGFFKVADPMFADSGHENDTYFMVVNGLTSADGSKYDCTQRITLNLDNMSSLKYINQSGTVNTYPTTPTTSGNSVFTFELKGGEGRLFKFSQGETNFIKQGPYPMEFVY